MAHGRYPRDAVPHPFEGYPAYGAIHEVLPDTRLRQFLASFSEIADSVFRGNADEAPVEVNPIPDYEPDEEFEPVGLLPEAPTIAPYDPRVFYKVFDPDRMAATVLEMDPAQKMARTLQQLFERQDFGAVEQDARNEIDRHAPVLFPSLTFKEVIGVGRRMPGVNSRNVYQKLALIADTTCNLETLEFMGLEQEKLITALKRRFKQDVAPWSLIPLVPFTILKRPVTNEQYVEIIEQTNALLHTTNEDDEAIPAPLHIDLERKLKIRHKSSR